MLSYNERERKHITEPMQPSAGGAIEFANPRPVNNQLIIAHAFSRAYEAYETPIP